MTAHAAIPCCGGIFDQNAECCSLAFSSDVPGVAECLSTIYQEWRDGPHGGTIREWRIDDRECLDLTRRLWSLGFPVGPSSGLNLAAALRVRRELGGAARVVTVFPDRMERYFSHKVFDTIRREADTTAI